MSVGVRLAKIGCISILDLDSAHDHRSTNNEAFGFYLRRPRLLIVIAPENRFHFADNRPVVRNPNFDAAEEREYFDHRRIGGDDRSATQIDVAPSQDRRRFAPPK